MDPIVSSSPHRLLISLIINNYNYAPFLEDCIRSTLSQTYSNIEVILVDDGSTDASLSIAHKFADQIRIIAKPNGGQASAMNTGFYASNGAIIIFVDADDRLMPEACEVIAAAWTSGTHHLSFGMSYIDESGRSLGRTTESKYRASGAAWPSLITNGFYVFMPTTGNAWSRLILDKMLPIPEPRWRGCADMYLVTLSPVLSDHLCILDTLAEYRIHGANMWFRNGDHDEAGISGALLDSKQARIFRIQNLALRDLIHFAFNVFGATGNNKALPYRVAVRLYREILRRESGFPRHFKYLDRFKTSLVAMMAALHLPSSERLTFLLYFMMHICGSRFYKMFYVQDVDPTQRPIWLRQWLAARIYPNYDRALEIIKTPAPLPHEPQSTTTLELDKAYFCDKHFTILQSTLIETNRQKFNHILLGRTTAFKFRVNVVLTTLFMRLRLPGAYGRPTGSVRFLWPDGSVDVVPPQDGDIYEVTLSAMRFPVVGGATEISFVLDLPSAWLPRWTTGPWWEQRIIGSELRELHVSDRGGGAAYPAVPVNHEVGPERLIVQRRSACWLEAKGEAGWPLRGIGDELIVCASFPQPYDDQIFAELALVSDSLARGVVALRSHDTFVAVREWRPGWRLTIKLPPGHGTLKIGARTLAGLIAPHNDDGALDIESLKIRSLGPNDTGELRVSSQQAVWFDSNNLGSHIGLTRGFHLPEHDGAWQSGYTAEIALHLDQALVQAQTVYVLISLYCDVDNYVELIIDGKSVKGVRVRGDTAVCVELSQPPERLSIQLVSCLVSLRGEQGFQNRPRGVALKAIVFWDDNDDAPSLITEIGSAVDWRHIGDAQSKVSFPIMERLSGRSLHVHPVWGGLSVCRLDTRHLAYPDAIECRTGHGNKNGTPCEFGLVLSSEDILTVEDIQSNNVCWFSGWVTEQAGSASNHKFRISPTGSGRGTSSSPCQLYIITRAVDDKTNFAFCHFSDIVWTICGVNIEFNFPLNDDRFDLMSGSIPFPRSEMRFRERE